MRIPNPDKKLDMHSEEFLHSLMRKQLKLSIACALAFLLVLLGLPQSRDYFLSLIQSQGARAKIAFETGSLEMLRSAVANRMGVGLLATDLPYDLTYDGGRIVRVPLAGDLPPHRVALARNPSIPQGPVARAFEAQARAVIAGQ